MNSARLSENLSYIFANNKVTGQPVKLPTQISIFV